LNNFSRGAHAYKALHNTLVILRFRRIPTLHPSPQQTPHLQPPPPRPDPPIPSPFHPPLHLHTNPPPVSQTTQPPQSTNLRKPIAYPWNEVSQPITVDLDCCGSSKHADQLPPLTTTTTTTVPPLSIGGGFSMHVVNFYLIISPRTVCAFKTHSTAPLHLIVV
jgi:hypothetical protein